MRRLLMGCFRKMEFGVLRLVDFNKKVVLLVKLWKKMNRSKLLLRSRISSRKVVSATSNS